MPPLMRCGGPDPPSNTRGTPELHSAPSSDADFRAVLRCLKPWAGARGHARVIVERVISSHVGSEAVVGAVSARRGGVNDNSDRRFRCSESPSQVSGSTSDASSRRTSRDQQLLSIATAGGAKTRDARPMRADRQIAVTPVPRFNGCRQGGPSWKHVPAITGTATRQGGGGAAYERPGSCCAKPTRSGGGANMSQREP